MKKLSPEMQVAELITEKLFPKIREGDADHIVEAIIALADNIGGLMAFIKFISPKEYDACLERVMERINSGSKQIADRAEDIKDDLRKH